MIELKAGIPADKELLRRIVEMEEASYGRGVLVAPELHEARYYKNPSLFAYALDGDKLIGAWCMYPVRPQLRARVYGGTFVDDDLPLADIAELDKDAINDLFTLDVVVDPAYRSHGVMHKLWYTVRLHLRELAMQGYRFGRIFGFGINDDGRNMMQNVLGTRIVSAGPDGTLLGEIDAMACITGRYELRVAAVLENVTVITAFADGLLNSARCPAKTRMQMDIAIDEMFSNIVLYSGSARAVVRLSAWAGEIELVFIDEGVPYDPLQAPPPDTGLSAEERGVGGLGIFMVRRSMDAMRYERAGERNVLTLYKSYKVK